MTLDITNPEMVVLVDEVGSNTSLNGDGHVCSQAFMCKKAKVP